MSKFLNKILKITEKGIDTTCKDDIYELALYIIKQRLKCSAQCGFKKMYFNVYTCSYNVSPLVDNDHGVIYIGLDYNDIEFIIHEFDKEGFNTKFTKGPLSILEISWEEQYDKYKYNKEGNKNE